MNKTTLLTVAVVVLFLMNVGIISFLLLNKPPRPDGERNGERNGEGPKHLVIERLHFDRDQIDRYDALIEQHQKTMRAADEEIMQLKRELFSLLPSPIRRRQDSIIERINSVQRRIEHAHFDHFSGIRTICRPDQMNDFNTLSHELAEIFSPKEHRPR